MIDNRNIFLIGMMGSWKSTVGCRLAKKLEWKFVDLDDAIETFTGLTIADLFEVYGESEFRKIEAQQLRLIARNRKQVVATGGGAILSKRNRRIFRDRGFTVFLKAQPETLAGRIKNKNKRPLLRKSEDVSAALQEIWMNRKNHYETAAHYCLDTDQLSPTEVIEQIFTHLNNFQRIK